MFPEFLGVPGNSGKIIYILVNSMGTFIVPAAFVVVLKMLSSVDANDPILKGVSLGRIQLRRRRPRTKR